MIGTPHSLRAKRLPPRADRHFPRQLLDLALYLGVPFGQAAFFQPRFIDLMGEALAESRGVREVMAGLVAGTQPYATLKWSLAKTVEVGLAWRLVRSKWYN